MEERRSRSIPSLLNISTGACECVNKPSSWTRLNWKHRLLQKKIQPQFKPSVVSDPSDAMLWPPFFSHHRHHRNRCSMLPTLIPTLQTKKPKIRWWRTPTCRRRSKTDSEGLRTTRQTSTSARVSAMVTSWGDPQARVLYARWSWSSRIRNISSRNSLFPPYAHLLLIKEVVSHGIIFSPATISGFNNSSPRREFQVSFFSSFLCGRRSGPPSRTLVSSMRSERAFF